MAYTQTALIEGPLIRTNGKANKLESQDRAFHDWYRFVLAFPPHLVRDYMDNFGLNSQSVVLDPFCGTGTTLVECKLRGISSFGTEANPFAHFATSVKTDWELDADLLYQQSRKVAEVALDMLRKQGIDDKVPFDGDIDSLPLRQLSPEADKLILTNSISPLPLHKALVLLEILEQFRSERTYRHQILALADALVFSASNLHFGPEVGVGKPKSDAPVIASWLSAVEKMANDLRYVADKPHANSHAYLADARRINEALPPESIDAVITSPPYPNEKDYTRITRLEFSCFGFH